MSEPRSGGPRLRSVSEGETTARERAIAAFARGALREAAALFDGVARADPGDVYARLKLGDIWLQIGSWERALDAYATALRHYISRAEAGKATRICASMWALLEAKPLETPTASRWAVEVANFYLTLDRQGEAFAILDRVAQAKIEAGRPTEAEEHLQLMLSIAPKEPKPNLRMAELRLAGGDTAGAVEYLRVGAEALALLQHDDVGRVYERILALQPDAEIARRLAAFLLGKGTPTEAKRAFRALKSALESDKDDLRTLHLLARYFEILDEPTRVIRVLKEMTVVARRTGGTAAGQAAWERLIALAPNDPELKLFGTAGIAAQSDLDGSLMARVPEVPTAAPVAGNFSVVSRLPANLGASSGRDAYGSPGLRYEVEQRFPHPIAYAFHTLRTSAGASNELLQNTNIVGVTLRFLAVVARCERIALPAGSREAIEATLLDFARPRSDGTDLNTVRSDGVALLRSNSLGMLSVLIDPSEADGGFDKVDLLCVANELIPLRNRLVKQQRGAGPDRNDQLQMQALVLRLLREFAPIGEHILAVPQSAQVHDGIKAYRCIRLAGYSEDFEEMTIECDLDLEQGHVYMLSKEDRRVISLHPFYILAGCDGEGGCRESHLFYLEKLDPGKSYYVSMQGHKLRRADAHGALDAALLNDAYAPPSTTAEYLRDEESIGQEDHPPGYVIDHRYKVIECLRKGGMSDVYKVAHVDHGREHALKFLPSHMLRDRRSVDRFRREARQLKTLVHPNVVRLVEFRETLGERYIVMELAGGWKKPDGHALDLGDYPLPLDFPRAVAVACELAAAVSHMHARQIVHRDIKPSNVLLFEDGHVKLTDFGLARTVGGRSATLSAYGAGTELYMSPEQLGGTGDLPRSTDMYSLGLVLFELFSGRRPFQREHHSTEVAARLKDEPPPLSLHAPDVPAPIASIIERCLRRNPAERPGSASQVRLVLAEYLPAGESSPPP